jgi:hypothetical protein
MKITCLTDKIECSICDAAKMKRRKYAKEMPDRARKPGEVIYSDVCGKISPPTLFNQNYVIHFLDEATGYLFVYLAQHKSEAFELFKKVRRRIKNHFDNRVSVKLFVTDGGGEYIGAEFKDFLESRGINHSIAPPNSAPRVGKSERLNKVLFDHARAMLKARQMPLKFWGEAILYAAYIRNRTTKRADKTRHELWTNDMPSLKHCLPFGTPVMYHNAERNPKKLDDRASKGIFVGFDEISHAYRIYDPVVHRVINSRDVHALPNEEILYQNNDWDQPFVVENDDNWLMGGSNVPDNIAEDDIEYYETDIFDNPIYPQVQQLVPDDIRQPDKTDIQQVLPIDNQPLVSNDQKLSEACVLPDKSDDSGDETKSRKLRSQGPLQGSIQEYMLSAEDIYHVLQLAEPETPNNYFQAINSEFSEDWKKSIAEEQESLIQHQTFKVVPRPRDKPIVKSRYVFKIKTDEKGSIARFKTRIVAKGYTQTQGIDYFDTFSPALRLSSFRYLISAAFINKFKIHHLDVQTAFLNGELAEEIYMEIPEGFNAIKEDRRSHVLKLSKSIYGLKQASRCWNEKFTAAIVEMGFTQSKADPCLFIKYAEKRPIVIIGIFVDDCFVAAEDAEIRLVTSQLMEKFKMHDLGMLSFALGIKVDQTRDSIKLSQVAYIDKCLQKFGMSDAKIASTPLPEKHLADKSISSPFENINQYQQLVGCLIYLSNSTRPDIAYSVGHLARNMQSPTETDWSNGKRVLRYLKGTRDLSIIYSQPNQITGYSDSSYAEEKDRKSISGYIFMQAGAPITWRSSKQNITAQSSMEAEYIALADANNEAEWLLKLRTEIFPHVCFPIIIHEDNMSAINLSQNPVHSNRSKHIAVRFHSIRDAIAQKHVEIRYLPTSEMIADIMTKALGRILHCRFVEKMGLKNLNI